MILMRPSKMKVINVKPLFVDSSKLSVQIHSLPVYQNLRLESQIGILAETFCLANRPVLIKAQHALTDFISVHCTGCEQRPCWKLELTGLSLSMCHANSSLSLLCLHFKAF